MSQLMPPYVDARKWEAHEKRSALVHIDGAALMFTASWGRPSSLVPRPDGAYRRLFLVQLQVPSEHRERCFHRVSLLTLLLPGDRPALQTDDVQGVHSRDLQSVTLAAYIDGWH